MEFKLPDLGENIESGDIVNVLVAVGDAVTEGQSVLEIEAGKATMEIPSPVSGTVSALSVAAGDTVAIGQTVMTFETGEQKPEDGSQKPEDRGQQTEDGDQTSEPEPVVEEEPEPVVEEKIVVQASPAEPDSLSDQEKQAEHTLPDTGSASDKEPVAEKSEPESRTPNSELKEAAPLPVSAAPNVRRLARELGVDVHQVPASGPGGYVTADDVKNFTKTNQRTKSAPWAADSGERTEKMSAIRKATMKHMEHCWATIPHVTQHDVADITKLEELRKRYAPRAEAAGAKLTMTAILIKVIASALKLHPKFNCTIDPDKAEIVYKNYYNIGVAMDTPKGLLVPVVKNGDKKNFIELALELGELANKAREGKIQAGDLNGGTFTFTNLGGIGGSFFTPIVNSPEVAILGTGRAKWEPGIEDGKTHFRLPLSLSYDHRIIDGADGARFLKWIVEAIEEPMLLSLEG